MAGSISALNNLKASPNVLSSAKLTESTKSRLEALGIDTSNIKTEAQGLSALSRVRKVKPVQKTKPVEDKGQMEALREQAVSLASKLGISVSFDAKIPDILAAIAASIAVLKVQAANNPAKLQQVKEYQAQYSQIVASLSAVEGEKQKGQTQISNSMTGIANYNKIFHNLA